MSVKKPSHSTSVFHVVAFLPRVIYIRCNPFIASVDFNARRIVFEGEACRKNVVNDKEERRHSSQS